MGHFYLTLWAAIQVSCYHARFQPHWYSPRVNDACFFLMGIKNVYMIAYILYLTPAICIKANVIS